MFAQHLPFLPNCTLPEGMGRSDQRRSTNSTALPKRWAEGWQAAALFTKIIFGHLRVGAQL